MTIEKESYEKIINDINVGNSIAEADALLELARVETPIFNDILLDRYDIIPGQKGAGKTAIFKIIKLISNNLLLKKNLIIITGVNSKGDSIFNKYTKEFKKFSELEFENFWKLYFITLIYNDFINNNRYEANLSSLTEEITAFKEECYNIGIPEVKSNQTKSDILAWVINAVNNVKKAKGNIMLDTANPTLFSLGGEIEMQEENKKTPKNDFIYINKVEKILKDILEKSNFKLWLILDRLDEVFERYSLLEFNGLRGLLRAYKSFDITGTSGIFRIKLFLRDDIISFLTDSDEYKKYFKKKKISPLTAVTHIFARKSDTLTWTEDEIEQLILNRLLIVNEELKKYLGINVDDDDIKKELRNKKTRIAYWNSIFPKKIGPSSSLKWIYRRLRDSNGVVTPRSVIDMLEGAVNHQKRMLLVDHKNVTEIIPFDAIKKGLDIASSNKLKNDIYNEFPLEQPHIKILQEFGKHKLTKEEVIEIFGKNWKTIIKKLIKIGIIRYVKDSKSYSIEYLYRPSLNITYKY